MRQSASICTSQTLKSAEYAPALQEDLVVPRNGKNDHIASIPPLVMHARGINKWARGMQFMQGDEEQPVKSRDE